jgi:acetyl-CoA acetyltransferase
MRSLVTLLAVAVIQAVMQRSGLAGGEIDEVIVAQSYQSSEAPCVGRYAALAAGLPLEVPGYNTGSSRTSRDLHTGQIGSGGCM